MAEYSIDLKANTSTPATPDSGRVKVYNDDSERFCEMDDGAFKAVYNRASFTQASTVTVASTASETTLLASAPTGFTLTNPAGKLIVGRTIQFTGFGIYSTKAATAGTLTLTVKFGSTALMATAATTVTDNLTNRLWRIDGLITCRSVGGSGTVFSQGMATLFTGAAAATPVELVKTATVTVDTTATQAFNLTATWGTSDASNSISLTNLALTLLL